MGNKIIGRILAPPRTSLAIAGLTCASAVAFSGGGVYADTVTSGSQEMRGVLDTNTVTVSTDGTVSMNVVPSTNGSMAVGKSTVTVGTGRGGYQLYLSGANAGTNGYTSLYYDGNTSTDTQIRGIPTETPMAFTTANKNQWGYAVPGATGFSTAAQYNAVMGRSVTSTSELNTVKWAGINKTMKQIKTSASSDGDNGKTDVYYAIFVDNELMTGEYKNSVVYTAFVDGADKLSVTPFKIANGGTMTITAEYQSSSVPVTSASWVTVQLLDGDTSVGTCNNPAIQSNGSTGLLKVTCTVATNASWVKGKAYDVLMNLSIPGRTDTLSFRGDDVWANYNVMANGANMQDMSALSCKNAETGKTYQLKDSRDNKSYLVAKLADGNCWMTQNLALAGGTTITPANSNVKADYTLPTSSTSGFNDNTKAYMYNGSTHQNNTANSTSHTGAYYSWLAAIAKNDGNYSAADMTALETAGAQAAYSICPKNWRLPLRDNGMIAVKNMYSLDEFRTLWNQGVTGTAPLVGNYYLDSLGYSGTYAYWWSRESNSATDARVMRQDSSGFGANHNNRYVGRSVRCVLGV